MNTPTAALRRLVSGNRRFVAGELTHENQNGARRVYLCGLSMGALLAVHLASKGFVRQGLAPVSALALLAPAVDMAGFTWVFTQIVGRLPVIPGVVSKGARDVQQRAQDSGVGEVELGALDDRSGAVGEPRF